MNELRILKRPETEVLERALFEMKKVVVGQDRMTERLLVCLLARGHCLLEGAPGLAKTLAAETLARTVGGAFARLQFTPDLVPADIVGTRIYKASSESFEIELGPIFANIVLADEINRAPAKVQSALLEVMAERHVSIGGTTFPVPTPFMVMATQNPIESEGVYPLPEAQRDRFLMKVLVDYPSAREEAEIVRRMSVAPPVAQTVLAEKELIALQEAADAVFIHDAIVDYAVRLVLATRSPAEHNLGDLDRADLPRRLASGHTWSRGCRPGAGAPAGAGLRPPPGRLRRRPRHPAPPRAAVLRGDRRRRHRRAHREPGRRHRPRPEAGAQPGRRRRSFSERARGGAGVVIGPATSSGGKTGSASWRWPSRASSTASSRATTRASCPAAAASRPRAGSTPRATTCAAWTGT